MITGMIKPSSGNA